MTGNQISVLVVDDNPLKRQEVRRLLRVQADMAIAGEAVDGVEGIERYDALRPDITLMDLRMPRMGGIEALTAICAISPGARIIVLTASRNDTQARLAARGGAAGLLWKSRMGTDLCTAIRTVHAGGRFLPDRIALELARPGREATLSTAELEVLQLVSVGMTNRRVAQALGLPEETVRSRIKQILVKLEAKDRTHAVAIAVRRGLLHI